MQENADYSENRFSALLLDYQLARDDDRGGVAALLSVAGVAITLLAAMLALTGGDCRLRAGPGKVPNPTDQCFALPNLVLAATPVLPIAVISLMLIVGTTNVIRSFYLRSVEAELRGLIGPPFLDSVSGLRAVSLMEVTLALNSGTRGRKTYVVLAAFVTGTCVVVFGGLSIYIATVLPVAYRIGMALVYSPMWALLIIEGFTANFGGRTLFKRAIAAVNSQYSDSNPTASSVAQISEAAEQSERTLLSYLIFPRPEEASKILLIPVGYLVSSQLPVNAGAFGWSSIGPLLLCWTIFEYFIYQARYQLNDIRGVSEDSNHADAGSRGRLPVQSVGVGRAVTASLVVITIRALIATVLVVFTLPETSRDYLFAAALALVFFVAPYEFLRAKDRGRRPVIPIWLLVGGGYGIRGALGFALAFQGSSDASIPSIVMAFLSFAASGVALVTMCWALDAVGNLANSDLVGCFRFNTSAPLASLPHRLRLLVFIPMKAIGTDEQVGDSLRLRDVVALSGVTRSVAPWNIALPVSVTSGALSVLLAPTSGGSILYIVFLIALFAALVCAPIIFVVQGVRRLISLLVLVSQCLLTSYLLDADQAIPLALMLMVPLAISELFRGMSDCDIKEGTLRAISGVRSLGFALLSVLIGKATLRLIYPRQKI